MGRWRFLWLGLAGLTVILLVVSGCSKSSNMISSSDQQPKILFVSPADGATGVPASARVELVFSVPMDTGSVRANLCILGGDQMQMTMDSMTGMHASMDYSRIMEMMHQMSMPGHYRWNGGKDTCQFWPDSAMHGNTQYMIFMGRDMMGAGGHMDDQNQTMGRDWISHFTTSP